MFGRLWGMGALLGIGAAMCWAQPLADRAPLKGLVVDETGQPVASAVVTVRRQEDNGPSAFWGGEARADESGVFQLPQAQEGRYFLSVEAPGYAPLSNFALDWQAASPLLRLTVARLTRVVLHLSRPGGAPLSQSPVWIRLRTGGAESNSTRATTDANGDAVVPRVSPGTYNVFVATGSGYGLLGAAKVAYQENGARFDVPLGAGATVRVQTRDAKGKPLGGASLVLFPRSPEEALRLGGDAADPGENWALLSAANAPQALVARDNDGTLELPHVPPGQFSARLSLPGYGSLTRDLDTTEGQTIEWSAQFPERHAATLVVEVRDGQGQPVANTLVALRLLPLSPDGTFAQSSLFGLNAVPDPNSPPDLSFFPTGPGGRVGHTDEAGRLLLFPLKEGRYRVFASCPAPGDWLRSPVAREGTPLDINVMTDSPNTATVQVP